MTDVREAVAWGGGEESVARQYRRQLEAIANNATLALFLIDAQQRCTYMNPSAERLTGYTLAEMGDRPFHDVLHHSRPDGSPYPVSECPINLAFPEHDREQGEEVFVHKDGHFYPVAYTASPIYEGRRPVATILEVQDITQRRWAEALEAGERTVLEMSARGAPLGELLDTLVRIVEAQSGGEILASILLIDEHGRRLLHGAAPSLPEAYNRAIDGVEIGPSVGSCGTAAYRREQVVVDDIAADPLWADFRDLAVGHGLRACWSTPIISPGGRLLGTFALYYGEPRSPGPLELRLIRAATRTAGLVIERQRIDEELREQTEVVETINRIGQLLSAELDLQKLLQAVTDAATDLAGAQFGSFFYNALNDQGESYVLYTLSGVPREAFAQFPMPRNTAIFGPTFRGEGIVRLDDVTRDPRYGQNAPYHGMPAGHLPVRSYLAVPVFSRSGEVLGGLFFGHAETGVFTARVERLLIGIAAQAGIAIDNARLFAQTRDAIRLRDEFLSIASHELRNPVAGIKGAAQMLRRAEARGQLDGERVRRYVGIIDHTATRLATLTEDLLDVSRLRTGGLPIRPQPTDVAALVEDVVRRVQAQGESDRFVVALDCRQCPAVVDPDRLEQVMENLLSNAVKYSPGGGEIRVTLTLEGDNIVLHVRDSGIGLPEDALDRIFEPFGRASNAVARNIEGLGLGLYICRQIAEQHGGRLWAESAGEGHGTTLVLSLPRSGPPDPGVPTDAPSADGSSANGTPHA